MQLGHLTKNLPTLQLLLMFTSVSLPETEQNHFLLFLYLSQSLLLQMHQLRVMLVLYQLSQDK
jgi:hypothetical protein